MINPFNSGPKFSLDLIYVHDIVRNNEIEMSLRFTGATLGRGINRGIATLAGGALGVEAHRLASCFGNEIVEPIIIAVSVFLFGK